MPVRATNRTHSARSPSATPTPPRPRASRHRTAWGGPERPPRRPAASGPDGRLIEVLRDLSAIASPSGFTHDVVAFIAGIATQAGLQTRITPKGGLVVANHPAPTLMIAGHVDTLGAVVSRINGDGNLSISPWGLVLPSFESEYVTIVSSDDKRFRGTLLLNNPAAHVNRNAGSTERKAENMHIRLDALVKNAADTQKLGIGIGDFVCFDPRFEYTDTGFIKARFLDDKAGSAAMIDAMLTLGATALTSLPIAFFFSVHEEVGHGACAGWPVQTNEMLVVDMGVVGDGVAGSETMVSICVKDSSGPYDLALRQELVDLARRHKLPHCLDVFPFYGSDGSAALRAGFDGRVALIGPGVSASHGMERTHRQGLAATRDLIVAFARTRGQR